LDARANFHLDAQANMDFLDQTIAIWQPRTDRPLTREDAREIAHNVVGFFHVLREWAEEEKRSAGSADSSPAPAPNLRSDAEYNPAPSPRKKRCRKQALARL
jgi:hypothetical protein